CADLDVSRWPREARLDQGGPDLPEGAAVTSAFRAADWINLLVFSWFAVLAWRRQELDGLRRGKITAIGTGGVAITLITALILPHLAPPLAVSVTRDWIPYLLLLMFYWQSGQFVTRADVEFEEQLLRVDRRVVAPLLEWCARHSVGVWILAYLELAY